MPKTPRDLIEVECPCCDARLKIDPGTRAVISFKEKEKPPVIGDLQEAVQRLKGEAARREETFQKNLAEQKTRPDVLNRKFDELLKQARTDPGMKPRVKDIDLD